MLLRVLRASHSDKGTIGVMTIDGVFQCFTLEDPPQPIKIAGRTCIPDGYYQIKLRKELSPKTEQYRKDFPFFDYHLCLQDVPEFEHVYIHVGNSAADTDGCILVGDSIMNPTKTSMPLQHSRHAFIDLYKKIRPAIEKEECWIELLTLQRAQ